MAISTVNVKPRESGSGGLWGSIAGGVLGLGATVAAPFTGGTSLAALPAALGAAAGAAPLIGNAIDPRKVTGGKPVGSLQTAASMDPDAQMAMLADAKKATWEDPNMSVADKNHLTQNIFQPAFDALKLTKQRLMET